MSGNYFGFPHTATHFSQPQQQQGTYGATHFTPTAAASPHTSYVVASTARPSAAAAYETTYTAQPASQYYTTTPQRQEAHHQASSTAAYRGHTAAAAAYTTYTAESTPSYEKQTYYQQPQAAAQQHQSSHPSAAYYSAGGSATTGGRTAVAGAAKSTYTAYYQSGGNQQKGTAKSAYTAYYQGSGGQQKAVAKLPANYQSPAASFNQPKPAQPKQQQQQQAAAGYSSGQQSYTSGGSSYSGSSYSGNKKPSHQSGGSQQQQQQQGQYAAGHEGNEGHSYDAVVFSAASNYYQQSQRPNMGGGGGMKKPMNGQGGYKGPPRTQRPPPKPSQLHYCAVCKISCAGPLTYKEHLEGQKHKKKEEAAKTTTPTVIKSSQPSYRCELCDVTCTGMDAYNAHIRGKNHAKVFKLHTRLGKPIPSTDPVKLNATKQAEDKAAAAKKGTPAAAAVKKPVTPKINFVGGSKFSSVPGEKQLEGTKPAETKTEEQEPAAAAAEVKDNDSSNIQPVGEDYVEEIRNDDGKLVSFNCKLCDCRFNDPHAKNMHMKGRRHRLQYKSKVDPNLKVEAKPTLRNRRQMEDKVRRKMAKDEMLRRRDEEMRWRDQMRQYDEEMLWRQMEEERYLEGVRHHEEMFHEWMRRGGPRSGLPPPPRAPPVVELPSKKQENEIDRHVLAKHNSIYPKEQELEAVQNMVSAVESALKMVSDFLTESETPKDDEKVEVKQEEVAETKEEKSKAPTEDTNIEQKYRVMKGVMRVGVLAKGLLLASDLNMDLIVLCSEKPTRTLLERVFHGIPKQLPEITEEKFDLSLCVEEAAILLSVVINECPMKMKVSLTSPVMRDPPAAETADATPDPPDVLDKEKCLAALAALRHAKWFQAKAAVLSSCVVVIRVLRDLCDRIPTWAPLKGWPIELICERVISSAGQPLSPGDALRRVFEAIAGGLLLPGGPGIYDPCEREETDVLDAMTPQQKEEITASAQHALRLIVFRQVHKVLNMEPLFMQRRRFNNRKRRRDDNEAEQDGADGKKDKKEEEDATGSGEAAAEGK